MRTSIPRRAVLRGLCQGGRIALAVPLLDCLLSSNGTALADGRPLPVRFGTWFWGCGMNPERWTPKKTGADFDLTPELRPIAPVKAKISVLSGFNVELDGKPNHVHWSGNIGLRTGAAPAQANQNDLPTLDVLIADSVGTDSRFRSLEVTATGNPRHSYSSRSTSVVNPSEPSPLAFYTRLFGADFQDPNGADFHPDPKVMLRRSVLSSVSDDRRRLLGEVGAADRTRLDEYFTSVRQLEQQLDMQLQKPPPAEACRVPGKPADAPLGQEITQVVANHRLMTQLMIMALACNQTKVFNMVFTDSASSTTKTGTDKTHHTLTHEEAVDPAQGCQPQATWFEMQSIQAWAEFVAALDAVREGPGTLLDNCLVLAHSDTSFARIHSVVDLPIMLAGRAGGRVKPGLHVAGTGDVVSRVGLTLQQVMGVPVDRWGTGKMETRKPVGEILV
jgi:Protein of unknown function (DUF1552)